MLLLKLLLIGGRNGTVVIPATVTIPASGTVEEAARTPSIRRSGGSRRLGLGLGLRLPLVVVAIVPALAATRRRRQSTGLMAFGVVLNLAFARGHVSFVALHVKHRLGDGHKSIVGFTLMAVR